MVVRTSGKWKAYWLSATAWEAVNDKKKYNFSPRIHNLY